MIVVDCAAESVGAGAPITTEAKRASAAETTSRFNDSPFIILSGFK
jgi:hypothetical protein